MYLISVELSTKCMYYHLYLRLQCYCRSFGRAEAVIFHGWSWVVRTEPGQSADWLLVTHWWASWHSQEPAAVLPSPFHLWPIYLIQYAQKLKAPEACNSSSDFLMAVSRSLFSLLYWKHKPWQNFGKEVEFLAGSLAQYADYIKGRKAETCFRHPCQEALGFSHPHACQGNHQPLFPLLIWTELCVWMSTDIWKHLSQYSVQVIHKGGTS